MFNLMHKSLSRKPAVSREQSVSPTSHAGSGIRGSQALEDPEKTDPGKDRDLERNDEGKIARLGEYRWVWFGVVLLVLSMFLCLFLYVFKVFKP
jgi:hypothetical protein